MSNVSESIFSAACPVSLRARAVRFTFPYISSHLSQSEIGNILIALSKHSELNFCAYFFFQVTGKSQKLRREGKYYGIYSDERSDLAYCLRGHSRRAADASRTQARAHEEVTVEDLDLLHQNIRQATQRILQLGQSINDVGAYADQVGRQTRRDAKADAHADRVSQHACQDAIAHAHAVGRDAKKNALEGDAHTLQNANAYTNQKSD